MYLIKHPSAPFQGIKIAECFNRSIDTISQSEIKCNQITPIYEKKDEKKRLKSNLDLKTLVKKNII